MNEIINTGGTVSNSSLTVLTLKQESHNDQYILHSKSGCATAGLRRPPINTGATVSNSSLTVLTLKQEVSVISGTYSAEAVQSG